MVHKLVDITCAVVQDAEVAVARNTAQKVLEASTQPYKARCVELECLLQAKDAHIAHLEVSHVLLMLDIW